MDVDKTKDIHKRINQTTGKPFQEGDVDLSGRVFKKYHHKIGNDGYYLEEWKKDIENFKDKAKELNINYDLNQQSNQ